VSQTAPSGGVGPQAAVATLPPPTGTPSGAAMSTPTGAAGATVPRPGETPRRLRRLSTGMILLCIAFGVIGALSLATLAFSLYRAEANTAQLIRVQNIQTNLLSADATATNAFLVGGLEPTKQRAAYDQAIASTGSLIAEAADAQPADAAALAALNREVVDYAATIEQARANNRQGFPVGAQYLRNASADLRADGLPVLDALVQTNADRAAQEMSSPAIFVFVGISLLTLAGLIATQVWVARRFRRRLNTGLAAATVLVLLTFVVGVLGLVSVTNAVRDIQQGSFADVNAAAEARIEANNAKSNESLTLIARGSGSAFEKAWLASTTAVESSLANGGARALSEQWNAYTAVHTSIRKLDDSGQWDAAVTKATGAGKDSANSTFAAFDTSASRALESASTRTAGGLAATQPGLVIGAIAIFLAGLGAALLSRWGLAQRLKEYR
jgi:hypothetical protein